MTVKDLIEELSKLPQDLEVAFLGEDDNVYAIVRTSLLHEHTDEYEHDVVLIETELG